MKLNFHLPHHLALYVLITVFTVNFFGLAIHKTPNVNAAYNVDYNSWDGWIKFGDDSTGGMIYSTIVSPGADNKSYFSGYGFGAEGIEWVSFSSKDCDKDNNGFLDTGSCKGDNSTDVSYPYSVWTNVTGLFPDPPSVWLRVLPTTGPPDINKGSSAKLSWKATNVDSGNSCTATTNGITGWSGSKSTEDIFDTPPLSNTTAFSITCHNSTVSRDTTDQVTVYVCGNNVVEASGGEQCDDANNENLDGCSSSCKTEVAGAVCPNQICERSKGENIQNCRVDCSPNLHYQEI